MNATEQMLVLNWYEVFNTTWAGTAVNLALVADPILRAQTVIDLA